MTAPSPRSARSTNRRPALLALGLVAALLALTSAGCSSSSTGSTAPAVTNADGSPAASGTITVFAAASLTEAFTEAASAFEERNPDADVRLNFAASSTLARQLVEKAPADVFASADEVNMQKAVDAGAIAGEPVVFATNSLQIVVAPGNPLGIAALLDLARSDVVYVTAAPEVPVGAYAEEVLGAAGVTVDPSSFETDVKAVVTKVTSGEADAAIVYATDVAAAGSSAEGVDIPDDVNVVATYPLGLTSEAPNPAGAVAWADFLTSPEGQAVLASYGFGPP